MVEVRRILNTNGLFVVCEGGRNQADDSEDDSEDNIVGELVDCVKTEPLILLEKSHKVNQPSSGFNVLRRYHTYSGLAWAFIAASIDSYPPFISASSHVLAEAVPINEEVEFPVSAASSVLAETSLAVPIKVCGSAEEPSVDGDSYNVLRNNQLNKVLEEAAVVAAKQVFRRGGSLGGFWRPKTDESPLPSFYDWKDVYPELQLLKDNYHISKLSSIETYYPFLLFPTILSSYPPRLHLFILHIIYIYNFLS